MEYGNTAAVWPQLHGGEPFEEDDGSMEATLWPSTNPSEDS